MSIQLSKENEDYIKELAHSLKTQDNRATAYPIFLVQEVRVSLTSDGDDDGKVVFMTEEWDILDHDETEKLLEMEDNFEPIPDGYIKMYERRDWKDVQPFLTEKGAQRYIDSNKHNMNEPRIYAGSAYRNYEWQFMREIIQTLASQIEES